MITDQLEKVQAITDACRDFLDDIRSGNLVDFDGFGERFDNDYGQLEVVPVDALDEENLPQFRRQLRELERVRGQLVRELQGSQQDLAKRLTDMSKTQTGLGAYKSTLRGVQRGVRHAEG